MPRRLPLLLAALAVLAFASLAGIATAASTGVGAQNRVWAQNEAGHAPVGLKAVESPCSRPGSAFPGSQIASGFCVAAEAEAGRGVNFIVHPNGDVLPVPDGAEGPVPADSGKGIQFNGGSGGRGLAPGTSGVRIMDPVTSGPYQYPNGYASYFNDSGQTVNPFTGRTISNLDPFAHLPF